MDPSDTATTFKPSSDTLWEYGQLNSGAVSSTNSLSETEHEDSRVANDADDSANRPEFSYWTSDMHVCQWESCMNKFTELVGLWLHVQQHVLQYLDAHRQLPSVCLQCGKFCTHNDDLVSHLNGHAVICQPELSARSALKLPEYTPSSSDIIAPHSLDSETCSACTAPSIPIPSVLSVPVPQSTVPPQPEKLSSSVDLVESNSRGKKRKGSTIDDEEFRKFQCDITGCGKTFKRSGHLKRHMLVHVPPQHRERFHCDKPGCEKNYSTKYDLAAHQRQAHDGQRLYKCPERGCCRRFAKEDSLARHLRLADHNKYSSGEPEYDETELENVRIPP